MLTASPFVCHLIDELSISCYLNQLSFILRSCSTVDHHIGFVLVNSFILFNNSMLHLSRPHICRLWLLIAYLLIGDNDPISLYHHLQHSCMVSLFQSIVIFDLWSVIKVWFLIFPPWMAISSWFLLLFTYVFVGQDVSLSSMISLIFFGRVLTCFALNHAPYWLLSCTFSIFCFSLQFFSLCLMMPQL